MSGGTALDDFTNGAAGLAPGSPTASYLMARHFASLAADAQMLYSNPVVHNGTNYYGTLLMNPDLLGAIQQNNYIGAVNAALPAGLVNTAVAQALCLMTTSRTYTNASNPNGLNNAAYLNKTYTGTPVQILKAMLDDGYPVWSHDGSGDAYWNSAVNNSVSGGYSQVGAWFNQCASNPTYDTAAYKVPTFPSRLDGWIQANNWLIRTLAPNDTVTIGWQENMWAIGSGYWLHKTLTSSQIDSTYSTPVSNWLQTNAPHAITAGGSTGTHYILFDRYEMDDSAAPGAATLYNARSWDNLLTVVGQVSKANNNIPVMLWQIPGSHIPSTAETSPELFQNTAGSYVFSTAPVYFFGDSNLAADLSNMIVGPASSTNANTSVGGFAIPCGSMAYNCLTPNSTYKQYLLEYDGRSSNYNWSVDNGKLALAASNNVFAILWGGGNTTNVIKNFSNTDDHGWLARKIINYYASPTKVVVH